jgi:hypothetical protein
MGDHRISLRKADYQMPEMRLGSRVSADYALAITPEVPGEPRIRSEGLFRADDSR